MSAQEYHYQAHTASLRSAQVHFLLRWSVGSTLAEKLLDSGSGAEVNIKRWVLCVRHTLSCCTVEPLTTALQMAPSLVGSQVRCFGLVVTCIKPSIADEDFYLR